MFVFRLTAILTALACLCFWQSVAYSDTERARKVKCPLTAAEIEAATRTEEEQFWLSGDRSSTNFSFDSEVSLENSYRMLMTHAPAEAAKLSEAFENLEWDGSMAKTFMLSCRRNKYELMSRFNISEKQFEKFALKKGVRADKDFFVPTDFHPAYFQQALRISGEQVSGSGFEEFMEQIFNPMIDGAMIAAGFPAEAGLDSVNVELRHPSFEAIPAKFYKLITSGIHRLFKSPQTHLHGGIPADKVTVAQISAIARAVETRVTLRLAMGWVPGMRELKYYSYTSLKPVAFEPKDKDLRGVIRLGLDEFPEPVFSHNVEIRIWPTIEEGLHNLALMARLAEEPGKLKLAQPTLFRQIQDYDKSTGNLLGALDYASFILGSSADPAVRQVAAGLKTIADRIVADGAPTVALRKEVALYLRQNRVLGLLDRAAFQN